MEQVCRDLGSLTKPGGMHAFTAILAANGLQMEDRLRFVGR